MTLYTVFDPNDSSVVYGRGLSSVEAMQQILWHDGGKFEIRESQFQNEPCFDLWCKSLYGGWTKTVVFSLAENFEAAEIEIARDVIDAGWNGHPEAMTDEQFDEMMAKFEADVADEEE